MKKVAFICFANACRSQIAEGLSKNFGDGLYKAFSAGLSPLGMIAKGVYGIMEKRDIDISDQYSKGLDEVPLEEMDFVISMASFPAKSICPEAFSGIKINWDIPDPYGSGNDAFEEVTHIIEKELKRFIDEYF